jgi:hypothetical protein
MTRSERQASIEGFAPVDCEAMPAAKGGALDAVLSAGTGERR